MYKLKKVANTIQKGVNLMKNKYGIGFFAVIVIVAVAVTCAYQISYHRAREKAEAEIEAKQREKSLDTEDAVTADGHALKDECYYLMDVNGYVVVFLSDKETAYEYTDILCDDLPETLRQEIQNGKYIEDQEELYGFLENYSS